MGRKNSGLLGETSGGLTSDLRPSWNFLGFRSRLLYVMFKWSETKAERDEKYKMKAQTNTISHRITSIQCFVVIDLFKMTFKLNTIIVDENSTFALLAKIKKKQKNH